MTIENFSQDQVKTIIDLYKSDQDFFTKLNQIPVSITNAGGTAGANTDIRLSVGEVLESYHTNQEGELLGVKTNSGPVIPNKTTDASLKIYKRALAIAYNYIQLRNELNLETMGFGNGRSAIKEEIPNILYPIYWTQERENLIRLFREQHDGILALYKIPLFVSKKGGEFPEHIQILIDQVFSDESISIPRGCTIGHALNMYYGLGFDEDGSLIKLNAITTVVDIARQFEFIGTSNIVSRIFQAANYALQDLNTLQQELAKSGDGDVGDLDAIVYFRNKTKDLLSLPNNDAPVTRIVEKLMIIGVPVGKIAELLNERLLCITKYNAPKIDVNSNPIRSARTRLRSSAITANEIYGMYNRAEKAARLLDERGSDSLILKFGDNSLEASYTPAQINATFRALDLERRGEPLIVEVLKMLAAGKTYDEIQESLRKSSNFTIEDNTLAIHLQRLGRILLFPERQFRNIQIRQAEAKELSDMQKVKGISLNDKEMLILQLTLEGQTVEDIDRILFDKSLQLANSNHFDTLDRMRARLGL